MTNVALTNVPVTVKICTRWSKGPNFKVLSKLGQLTAEKLPTLSFCGGGVGWGGGLGWGGLQSHFHVQPPTTLRLGCR